MSNYQPRVVDAVLDVRMQATAAVLLEGPKACGKTETALQRAKSVVQLDVDPGALRAAEVDPSLLLHGDKPLLIDEWQLVPAIWDHVRRAADDGEGPGRFILTGSATPADGVRRHSGAGRIATVRMRPMSLFETGHSSAEVSLASLFDGHTPQAGRGVDDLPHLAELLVTGGWPHQLTHPEPQFVVDYLDQTTHVDINAVAGAEGQQVRRGRDPEKVLSCIRSIARNVATPAGEQTIAKDANLSRDAVRDYLAALGRLMIIEDQPAFNVHLRSSRNLRQTPHRHFVDPSLAAAGIGADAKALLADLEYMGLLFESMVVRDMRVLSQPQEGSVKYFHTDHHEIDIILSRPDGAWGAIEVKLGGEAPIEEGAASLIATVNSIDLAKAGEPAFMAVVTATGKYAYRRDDGVSVVPLTTLMP